MLGKINHAGCFHSCRLKPHGLEGKQSPSFSPHSSPQSPLVRFGAYLGLAFLHANIVNTGRWEGCQLSVCKQKPPASPGTLSFKRRETPARQRRERDPLRAIYLSGKRKLKTSRKSSFLSFIHSFSENIYPHSTVLQALYWVLDKILKIFAFKVLTWQ